MDTEKEVLKRRVVFVIVVCLIVGILSLVVFLTRSIIDNSYNTEKVLLEATIPEETTELATVSSEYLEGYTYEEFKDLPSFTQAILLMRDVPTDDMLDASVEKATILLSCKDSPYYQYMSDVEYSVGEVSKGYKVEFNINNEMLYVICSKTDATPNIFIKDVKFTEEEKNFYMKLGNCREAKNEDGTYSLYFL